MNFAGSQVRHDLTRRRLLAAASLIAVGGVRPLRAQSVFTAAHGDSEIIVLSDGIMRLPKSILMGDSIPVADQEAFFNTIGLEGETYQQPLNVTLWRSSERTVLFDAGSGMQFLDGTGLLAQSLAELGVSGEDITDVVFTHAHPDHLWGVLDDFDDLMFPNATYHMDAREFDYWIAGGTLTATPEARQSFVVGAQNRLPLIEERLTRFTHGDEVLPGVEAVDSHGHTPGHTSFVLHADGNDPVMVIGDAITHPVLSFAHPSWATGNDQDPEAGARTRTALLDRLAGDRMQAVAYHLPTPGLGRVEQDGSVWRWLEDA